MAGFSIYKKKRLPIVQTLLFSINAYLPRPFLFFTNFFKKFSKTPLKIAAEYIIMVTVIIS